MWTGGGDGIGDGWGSGIGAEWGSGIGAEWGSGCLAPIPGATRENVDLVRARGTRLR